VVQKHSPLSTDKLNMTNRGFGGRNILVTVKKQLADFEIVII
jgi:hypothetical protein